MISCDTRKILTALFILLLASGCAPAKTATQSNTKKFPIRGTLPWHNFLSGPTAWNEQDYEQYLDTLQQLDLNLIAFHCYTGGAQRYATYVEPLIKIEYRNVIPHATLDTSLTDRWGYSPLAVENFAFDTAKLFKLPPDAKAFGSDAALLAQNNLQRYERAQSLMRNVMQMAHKRNIKFAIGFEFGIHPPEFASVVPPESRIPGTMLPDPTHPSSIEILENTIDNILETYPGLDYIFLWLHEHTMYTGQARVSQTFADAVKKHRNLFARGGEQAVLNGTWSIEYIKRAHQYIKQKAPDVGVVISGWGGGRQLAVVLEGLDKELLEDIIFSCLNPGQGAFPHPDILAQITKNRKVWAIPWLEADARLWHPQPRVALMRKHIKLAHKHKLDGVLAIHWRTQSTTRLNLETFAKFAADPQNPDTVQKIYRSHCRRRFGQNAAKMLAKTLAKLDENQAFESLSSIEYFPYNPTWERLNPDLKTQINHLISEIEPALNRTKKPRHRENLNYLLADLRFTVLLDQVGRKIHPAHLLKQRCLLNSAAPQSFPTLFQDAKKSFNDALIEELFQNCAAAVHSKGQLGVLSSLNQKLYIQYRELNRFLNNTK